ncbi:MAG: FecR domain-containing protein [Parabacteroides sp.]|nr:FecR domain-containing protein [Parabacteroides sp.]
MIDEEHITKYLNRELSEKEAAEVVAWLEEDRTHQDFLFSIKEAHLLARYKTEAAEADTAREWEKLTERLRPAGKPSRRIAAYFPWKHIAAYAAAIALCLFIGWQGNEMYENGVYNNLTQAIETGAGQQVKTTLPDGTSVSLNACSSLSYSPYGWKKQRRVQLKGEAIFDVATNRKKPFIVETAQYEVLVTGTNFNLSAYEEDGRTITTLMRGKVEIRSGVRNELLAELSPGESLVFDNATHEYSIRKLPVQHVYAWSRQEIIFEGNTLQEKHSELARHFGYAFRIAPELQRLTYKATLRDESLTEFMGILARLTPNIRYRISEREKTVEVYLEK